MTKTNDAYILRSTRRSELLQLCVPSRCALACLGMRLVAPACVTACTGLRLLVPLCACLPRHALACPGVRFYLSRHELACPGTRLLVPVRMRLIVTTCACFGPGVRFFLLRHRLLLITYPWQSRHAVACHGMRFRWFRYALDCRGMRLLITTRAGLSQLALFLVPTYHFAWYGMPFIVPACAC